MEFLSTYWVEILVAIVFIGCLVVFYKRGKRDLVKEIILSLVVRAEKKYGSGTGELKYADVVNAFYTELPLFIRILFTPKDIDIFIEEAVDRLKEILSDGTTNLIGYDNENI